MYVHIHITHVFAFKVKFISYNSHAQIMIYSARYYSTIPRHGGRKGEGGYFGPPKNGENQGFLFLASESNFL